MKIQESARISSFNNLVANSELGHVQNYLKLFELWLNMIQEIIIRIDCLWISHNNTNIMIWWFSYENWINWIYTINYINIIEDELEYNE